MATRTYTETFDDGPGGWLGWYGNQNGAQRLEIENGVAISRGPWWIDYNHAPPGGGYLHLLYALHTSNRFGLYDGLRPFGGDNRFIDGNYPTDFTNASLTVRLKGDVTLRGAELVLLAQAKVDTHYVNHVLTGQPLRITPDWSEQTLTLAPDPNQWTCIGSRHDRTETYAWGDIADVLRDLNGDIILILFPLDVHPATPIDGDPHRLRAGLDYAVDEARLPQGHVMLDTVRIEFAGG